MNESSGSGCGSVVLMGTLLALIVFVAVAMTGLPDISAGGLTWNTAATDMREQTERLRIQEEQQTARLRIEQNADTQRTWALIIGAVAIIGTVGVVVVLITRAAAQRPVVVQAPPPAPQLLPPQVHMIMVQLPPDYAARRIAGEWYVVDDQQQYHTITDASRLLADRAAGRYTQ